MQLDVNVVAALVAVLVPVIGFGRWLVRLEGKQATHEAVCAERQKHIHEALTRIEKTQELEHNENQVILARVETSLGTIAARRG